MSSTKSDAPLLSDLLPESAINLNLAATHRDAVLAELVDQIKEIASQPAAKQTLLHALLEREQLHSTGVGDGVALPHARNALVGLVDRGVIVFGRHAAGVPYGSIDGGPAHLFFLLVAPTVTQHLAILSRVSRLLRDPKLRKALMAAENPAKVRTLIRDAEVKP
jgi:mannitol/fructose-specific phosphotransferase system IIA component (Ntr-type)